MRWQHKKNRIERENDDLPLALIILLDIIFSSISVDLSKKREHRFQYNIRTNQQLRKWNTETEIVSGHKGTILPVRFRKLRFTGHMNLLLLRLFWWVTKRLISLLF